MSHTMMTRREFDDRVAEMQPGEIVTYHVGSLRLDREAGANFGLVHNVATAAWSAFEEGKVHLAQRYVTEGVYAYLAIKRAQPFKRVVWTGCYDPDFLLGSKNRHKKPAGREAHQPSTVRCP